MSLIRGLFWGNQIVMSWVSQFKPAILGASRTSTLHAVSRASSLKESGVCLLMNIVVVWLRDAYPGRYFPICMGFHFCFECLVVENCWSWCLLEYVCLSVSESNVYILWAIDCAFCYAILIQYLVKRHGATCGYCQHNVAAIPQRPCCINTIIPMRI